MLCDEGASCLQVKMRRKFLLQVAKGSIPTTTDQIAEHEHPSNNYQVDPDVLGWAMAAVSSRAYHFPKLGGGPSLLPLVDMCNHSFTPNGRLDVLYGSATNPLPIFKVSWLSPTISCIVNGCIYADGQ